MTLSPEIHALLTPLGRGAIDMTSPVTLRSLFDAHARDVFRFARDLVGDSDTAHDVTQETFVRAHKSGRLEAGKAWLFGVARNVAYEHLRAKKKLHEPSAPRAFEPPPAPSTPEGALLMREADRVLEKSLAELSTDRRTALLLRIDHGLDYEEIGKVLDWNAAKVKNEIHRARLEMRTYLDDYMKDFR
jgi:RNA polymerase sigma-70 factor (ECF subfamily)